MTDLLPGGGEMGERIRSFDWSQTPLGPIEAWPQSLKTAVRIMLASRQPIWLGWGPELTKLYNDPYKAIVGGKHPAALGQPAAVVWREIWDEIGPLLHTALGGVEGTYVEARRLIMERNGYPEETYYTFSYSPIAGDDGSVGGIFCANTDDTHRVIGERQLALLRDLAAQTADARTVAEACALAASCLATNPYDLPFAQLYLVDPASQTAELAATSGGIERGGAAAPASVALDRPGLWPFAEVLASGRALQVDRSSLALPLPTGAWDRAPQQVVVTPIASQGRGGVAGLLVVGLNPYRLFDDGYRGFLDLVAAQIAAGIANAQAYEDERRRAEALAELDRAKTAFFSNVSHEFRTPLTLLLGPLDELLSAEGTLPPAQREQVELARRNALRLLKLVNILLDFSRLEAGRMQAAYTPTDLADLTADLASVFRAAVEDAGLRLTVSCPPLAEPVYVDREMWEKIVFNLLSNAFKFTFAGEIAITLRQVGPTVELTVRDSGTGIPEHELPHIFERFHRVKGARGRTFEGSGIGLALVRELAALHGGSVAVESEPGRGSAFTVSLPLGVAHLPPERIAPPPAAGSVRGELYIEEALRWAPDEALRSAGSETALAPQGGGWAGLADQGAAPARILLADDNADMRAYVSRLLSQSYTVFAVSDGAAALHEARRQPFDLVLADVMMPELDGFGLLRALRADDALRTIPVILLSARAGEEARVEGMQAGADDYLTKPFSARELLARIWANLELARIRREAAQREQQLRQSAEVVTGRLQRILAGINDDFVMYDDDWRYVYVNDNAAQSLGYPKEQLIGQRIWDLFPDAVGNRFYQEMLRGKAEGRDVVFEHYYQPWGKWIENRAYPIADGMLLFSTDITERKQAEEALRESEARFRNMADHAPVMIWVTEVDASCSYLSKSWYSFTGQEPENGLGFGWLQAVHPDDRAHSATVFTDAHERRVAFRLDYRLRRSDGVYRWAIDSAAPRFGPTGDFLGYIGSVFDITEIKQAELNAQFMADLGAAIGGMVELEPAAIEQVVIERVGAYLDGASCYFGHIDGELVEVRHEWRRAGPARVGRFNLGNYLPPEVVAQSRQDQAMVVDDATRDPRLAATAALLQQRAIGACIVVPVIHLDEWVGSLSIVSGQPRAWRPDEVQLLRDVAARVWPLLEQARAQAALRGSEARLQLLYAQEQAARAQAEEASRLKDEFLATVSHELRTPLTAFLGYAELLQRRPRDEAYVARTVAKMVRSAKDQAQLIEDLLDVSRIVNGKLRIELQRIDLGEVVGAALDTVRPTLDAKGLSLHLRLDPEAAVILGDANRLQQVVWNLLANATKFTPPGGSIFVQLEPEGREAVLSVRDTGQGISPAFLPFVFDRFRQADSTSTRVQGGIGLGLSIVRHLVELHGGSVGAMSPGEGQGATFTVRLPRLIVGGGPADDGWAGEGHSAQPLYPHELRGLRVLLVDDQPAILEVLQDVLEPCGVIVQACSSARGALEALRSWRPDVLVSDIAMPNEDGYWLIDAVRALPPDVGGATPAVALTAYVRVEDHLRVMAAGFQQYVPKPVEPAVLQHVLARLARAEALD